MLALVHDLEASRYLETIEELRQQTGRAPEHTMLGFSSENGRICSHGFLPIDCGTLRVVAGVVNLPQRLR